MLKFLAALLGIVLCAACSTSATNGEKGLPRAAPGYVRWLEKQSMKNHVPDLLAHVSQTELVWLNSGEGGNVPVLLAAAPVWLEVNAHASASGTPLFKRLLSIIPALSGMDITGLYMGPLGERLDIWLDDGNAEDPYGFSAASLTFDAAAGTEQEYASLASAAETAGIQLGSDLPPAATGAGPDFLLQARNAVGHAGLYAMLAAPKEIWGDLPPAEKDWDFAELSQAGEQALTEKGILPSGMRRDRFSWAPKGGWAATGPVLGSDGQIRRWLYRFEGSPRHPVLLWQDPFEQARRLYSAAIIRQTGLLGQALTGVRIGAWFGLEPESRKGEVNAAMFGPGLDALNDIARQVHRYGGWVLQADPLPMEGMEAVLAGPCDFCRDDLLFAALAEAFMEHDSAPPVALLKSWKSKNIDLTRLAHGFNDWLNAVSLDNPYKGAKYAMRNLPPEDREKFAKMLFAWKMGLPGLSFIGFNEILSIKEALSTPDRAETGSGMEEMLVRSRRKYGAAMGKIDSIMQKGEAMAVIFSLEKGIHWLLACNFSERRTEMEIALPQNASRAFDAADGVGTDLVSGVDGQNFLLTLDGRQARNVIFETK